MYTKRDYDSSYTYSMTVFVTSVPESTRVGDETLSHSNRDIRDGMGWDGMGWEVWEGRGLISLP